MNVENRERLPARTRADFFTGVAVAWLLLSQVISAQDLTGRLFVTVQDPSGAVIRGAEVRVASAAQIGGPVSQTTDEKGQSLFWNLTPGLYVLDIEVKGFKVHHEEDIRIRVGDHIPRNARMELPGVSTAIDVTGGGSRIDVGDPGFKTNFGSGEIRGIPTPRLNFADYLRWAPMISPTSPTSGITTTLSAAGSGTNENQFLFDGTNTTCSCNGVARAEPGIDFIQDIQVQSIGASAEYGNVQGAVINVVTRQGGNRFLYDASFYGQPGRLASQPVRLPLTAPKTGDSAYERVRFHDFTTNFGGPIVRDRAWFFVGYQRQRDADSQPGADPAFPKLKEQDKIFAKLNWKPTANLQFNPSFHDEFWVNPDRPTLVTPWEVMVRPHGSVPMLNLHMTHTLSTNTLWDLRVGKFVFSREEVPNTGAIAGSSRFDSVTGVTSAGPARIGALNIMRTTAKATLLHYRPDLLGVDHQLKGGVQAEQGGHRSRAYVPTGVRYVDRNGQPFEEISSPGSNVGGMFFTASGFVNDTVTAGRFTFNGGLRFDHNRAFHQDLPAVDAEGRETATITRGQRNLYTWNLWSPRAGFTAKLTGDNRTVLRASWGRFHQGVLTGELEPFHPGATAITTRSFNPATGDYTGAVRVVDPNANLQLDPDTRAPRTDEFSLGVDREIAGQFAVSFAYVRKDGSNFIGWTDVGGQYREETRTLSDGRSVPVFVLTNSPSARRFRLTNPDGYSLTYNGLVMAAEKRWSHGWQVFGSYTYSRASGLLASSGANAAGPQVSTVSPPQPIVFGRDPNDYTNASGLLPNDRPHMFRVRGGMDVLRTGFTVAGNFAHFSGKPWTATAQVPLPQGDARILIEQRGSRRLSSQSPLDLRLSRTVSLSEQARMELLIDVLNVLNDTAEEGLATDNLFSPNFNRPTIFMDPRRVMLGVRLNLGR